MRRLTSGIFLLLTSVAVAQARDPFQTIERLRLTEPAAEGVQVEVLDPDWEPIAGASVGFVSNDLLHDPKTRQLRSTLGRQHGEELFMKLGLVGKYGTRFRSGKDGMVILPNDEAGYLVAIWTKDGQRYAATKNMRKGAGELTLELEALEEIAVRVVDQRGRPVSGLPVSTSAWRGDLNHGATVAGWTDRKGIAYVRSRFMGQVVVESLTVGVVFVGDESVVETVDLSDGLPEDLVELQMPPFGQIKAILYDEDGKPSTKVRRATIEIVERFGEKHRYESWSAPIVDPDGVTFPAVALNQDVKIQLRLEDSHQQVTVEGAGPRQPREMTILTPEAGPKAVTEPTLSVRVLDSSGEPVKAEELGVAFVDGDYARAFTRRTDKEGQLDIVVPSRHRESDGVWVYIMRRGLGDESVSLGGMSFALPDETPSGRLELGDRKLEEEPVRLAGQVVDLNGQPVSGVEIKADRIFRRSSSSWSGDAKFIGQVGHTDADGKFELRHVFDEMGDLEIELEGHYVKDMPGWALGDVDVKFVVAPAGKVHVSIKDPPDDAFHLTLANDAEPKRDWDAWLHSRNGKMEASWEVPPGTYALYSGRSSAEDAIVDKIQVEAGKSVEDERLAELDWTQFMTELSIKVVDEQGKPLPHAEVMVWQQKGNRRGWSGSGTHLDDEDATSKQLVSKDAKVVVHVEAKGYAEFIVHQDVEQDLDVVLVKLQRLEVKLDGDLELPDNMRLGITLVQENENQKKLKDSPVQVGKPEPEAFFAGVARPCFDGDAECEIWLTLMRAKRDGEWRPKQLRISHHLPNFKVTEETLRQGLKIPVDDDLRAEIESAVEQLQER